MTVDPMVAPLPGPSPSAAVAKDMVRRGLMISPVVVGGAWLLGGSAVAASVGYGMAIILVNFLLSAYLLAWAARISLGLIPSVALGGYVMRLALVFVAVWLVRNTSWVRMIPLGLTIIATHLGLLVWELRHVSASFAYPGLKPSSAKGASRQSQPAIGYRSERHRRDENLKPT